MAKKMEISFTHEISVHYCLAYN